ncbi:MAG: YdbH domain-containing protein [Hyphomonadaceae bacterium]
MTEISSKPSQTLRWRLLQALVILLAIVIVALVALWVGRKSLAQRAVQSWCGSIELSCSGEFSELGLSSASLKRFAITNGTDTPFSADAIDVSYSWEGLTEVRVKSVKLETPIIRGVLERDGISFYGLETAYQDDGSETSSSSPPPHVAISNGTAVLQTDAGEISAAFEADGRLIEDGTVNIVLTPAHLEQGDARLIWTRGDVDLQFFGGAVTGQVNIDIEHADLADMSAQNVHVNADITDGDGELKLMMKGAADIVSHGERLSKDIIFSVTASAARPNADERFDVLSALRSFSLDASASELVDPKLGARAISLLADLTSDDRVLAGPIAIGAEAVSADYVEIDHASVSGDITLADDVEGEPVFGYDGKFLLRGVDASGTDPGKALKPADLPSVVQPHAAQVRRVLEEGLSKFDFGASFQANVDNKHWELIAREPIALQADNGLTVALEPFPTQPWLTVSDEMMLLSGLVKSGGGGGPDFQTYLEEVSWRDGALKLFARDGVLEDWDVEGAMIHAQYAGLSFEQAETSRFFIDGEIALAGDIADLSLERTRLFGKLEGAYGSEGWRVQTADGKCVGLTMGGVRSGTIALDPLAIALCPTDGRFVRQEAGATVGRINLGDINLPFVTGDSSGTFVFDGAQLDWSSGDELELTIKGRSLALPMVFGETTLNISSAAPTVSAFVRDGPLRIVAALDDTVFSGTMIPANVRADAFKFEGLAAEAGLEGVLRADTVHISDLAADPLYEPLVSDLEAVLRDGAIDMNGALLNEKTQTAIADMRLQLHLAELNGTAQLKIRPLIFQPGGLQPTALSERLRGVLTSTSGELSGQANIDIVEGEPNGTGNVTVRALSFDTLKAGSVSGVNGQINFSDILGLQSEPHQVFTIDEINPGVPLTGGLIQFQLNGAETTTLEAAHWPFAGGMIRIIPTEWTLGSDSENVMVELVDIELAGLIETLKVPDVLATGTVSGAFPIEFVGANVMVRQAVLRTDEQGGTFAYLGSATETLKGQNEYADFGLEAIKKLDFSVMEIGLDGNLIGRLLLSMDLLGANPDVLDGAVFKFGLTVDSDLVPLLDSLSRAPTESYISEGLALERERAEREQNE